MKDDEIQKRMEDADECAADMVARFGVGNSVLIAAMVLRQTLESEEADGIDIKVYDEKLRVQLLDEIKVSTTADIVH
jgi:hypothetical protein